MGEKFTRVTPELYAYLTAHRSEQDAIQVALIADTAALGGVSRMQIAPEQGAFMTLLARAIGARRMIEVGTFTGYSALCLALSAAVGRPTPLLRRERGGGPRSAAATGRPPGSPTGSSSASVPALETLRSLPRDPVVDLSFVDADKEGYRAYYEEFARADASERPHPLRQRAVGRAGAGGRGGASLKTRAIQALNDALASDPRVESVMLPIADGLTICRKRAGE